jgi:transmembrane sensor
VMDYICLNRLIFFVNITGVFFFRKYVDCNSYLSARKTSYDRNYLIHWPLLSLDAAEVYNLYGEMHRAMKEFNTLKAKIERGEASDEEVEQFRQYIEGVALEEMARAEMDSQVRDRSEEFGDVLLQIQERERKESKTYYVYLLGKVAAVVCVALLTWMFYQHTRHRNVSEAVATNTMKVLKGKNHIKLQDGTTVDLNAGSTLSYSPDFGATGERIVQLEGEAFFDVAEDPARPFLVKTGDVTTRVLGTAFDVRAYRDQNDIVVTVARGKVSVSVDGGTALLTKNQQITYHKASRRTETKKLDVVHEPEWKDNYLVFDDVTMEEAVAKISARFQVPISFRDSGILRCHVRMVYVNGEGLEQILDDLMAINQATYERTSAGIVITGGDPCP